MQTKQSPLAARWPDSRFGSFFVFVSLISLMSMPTLSARAGTADTIQVYSASMHKSVKCVVIQPSRPPMAASRLPVLYLLHGYSGSYAQWPGLAPQLKEKADQLQMIFVCPDGGYGSWYFDSPVDSAIRYETFITKELVRYIDAQYPSISDRRFRAITGLSMGGHGALYLAIRHLDLFGAAGATSGGVDFRPFPNNWDLKKDLGDYSSHKDNWDHNTVTHMAGLLHNGDLQIIFDCGVDDFFLPVNRNLHQQLLSLKVDHDYIERPGGHDSEYWRNSIDYQLLFFRKFFDKGVQLPSKAG